MMYDPDRCGYAFVSCRPTGPIISYSYSFEECSKEATHWFIFYSNPDSHTPASGTIVGYCEKHANDMKLFKNRSYCEISKEEAIILQVHLS